MPDATILPGAGSGLVLESMTSDAARVILRLAMASRTAACPLCGQAATRVQSRYWRTLTDVPWQGVPVQVKLRVRRFWCDTVACARRIFAERVPRLAAPYARRTCRCSDVLTAIAFALGGEAGARLLPRLGLQASPDTLLRLTRRAPSPPVATPVALGVDDFAFRRGHTYGTLLVDLTTHRPIDLLPDRATPTLAAWLTQHRGVRVVARDRSGAYAEAVRRGAPRAVQVADRWHLLKNVGDALEHVLARNTPALRAAAEAVFTAPPTATGAAGTPVPSAPPPARVSTPRPDRRAERYGVVRALAQQGVSIAAISRQTGIARPTIRSYLRAPACPERAAQAQYLHALDAHELYVRRRWAEGCTNAAELWRELRARGFAGSAGTVRRYVGQWRTTPQRPGRPVHTPPSHPPPPRPPSPRRVRWWLLMEPATRTEAQQQYIDALCERSAAIGTAAALTRAFNDLLRRRNATALDGWLQAATSSGIAEFASCAAGLQHDRAAVLAALRSRISNGQTEGQVNRLKLIKRQGYGRANFDLLRRRVLQDGA